MTDLATNVLYYGDNLDILRRYRLDAADLGILVFEDVGQVRAGLTRS